MTGKYDPLERYLRDLPASQEQVTLSFESIEQVLNDQLPPPAHAERAWWGNQKQGTQVESIAWMDAGWLVKGNQYTILFVDPKGMTVTNYQYKIDGYKELFCEMETNQFKEFKRDSYKVHVALAMYTDDSNRAPQEYRKYWYDRPQEILEKLVN